MSPFKKKKKVTSAEIWNEKKIKKKIVLCTWFYLILIDNGRMLVIPYPSTIRLSPLAVPYNNFTVIEYTLSSWYTSCECSPYHTTQSLCCSCRGVSSLGWARAEAKCQAPTGHWAADVASHAPFWRASDSEVCRVGEIVGETALRDKSISSCIGVMFLIHF